jgi:hypothetical protein
VTLGARWFLAFSFLLLAVHEAHELAHAVVGRWICGEWPIRDFNSWRFASECSSWLPTAAGPLFSYSFLLLGALIAQRRTALQPAGIALIFAANPFARIFTVAMGGGDEMVVAQHLAGLAERTPTLRFVTLLFVLAVCGPAILVAWRSMRTVTRRALWFPVALLWPMVLTGIGLFVIGNGLLRKGMLATPVIAGTPLFVVTVSAAAVVMTAVTLRWFRVEQREHAATAIAPAP